jgi:hypothetical protein
MTDYSPNEYRADPVSELIFSGRYATHAFLVLRK